MPPLNPELKTLLIDVGTQLKAHKGAIVQLEDNFRSLPGDINKTVERKLQAVRQGMFGPGGQYRGILGSEDNARAFGLLVLSLTNPDLGVQGKALEMLKSDHRSFIEQRDVTGGESMVPHEFSTRFHRLVEDSSTFAMNAFRMPMVESDSLSFVRRISGFRARKSRLRTASDAQNVVVAPVNLQAEDYDIYTTYPDIWDEDMLAPIGELIALEMVLGFSLAIEEDGLIGDGTEAYDNVMGITTLLKQINGVDDGGGLVLASGAAGDGWDGITKDNILKLISIARHVRPGQGKCYCSPEFYWQRVAKLVTDAGGVTRTEMEGRPQFSIFGVPAELSFAMPRTAGNSQIPLIYGDIYQSSTLGDRRRLQIRTSRDFLFSSRQVAVLGVARYAINNHSLGDADTAGPVVGLITPPAA